MGFPEYSFGFTAGEQERLLESGESVLNEQGELMVEFPLDKEVLGGRFGLKVTASVIDFDGRSSGTSQSFKVEPSYLIGIASLPPMVKAGVKQSVNLVVLDKDGQRIGAGKVRAELMQESGGYVRKRNQAGDLYWDYQRLWRRFLDSELDLANGEATYSFDLAYGGEYVLSVTYQDPSGNSFTSAVTMNAQGDIHWDDYSNRDKPFEVLDLVADKTMYEPGQTATVYIQPHKKIARYLVTLEQDKVISHRVMEAQPRDQEPPDPHQEGLYAQCFRLGPGPGAPGRLPRKTPGLRRGGPLLFIRNR